jgi:hypothetical protein
MCHSAAIASPQEVFGFRVDFFNICNTSVHVTAFYYSNINSLDYSIEKSLEPNQSLERILSVGSYIKDIRKVVSDNYSLKITANGNAISLGKAQFLRVLEKANYKMIDYGLFIWTISDPSLCP